MISGAEPHDHPASTNAPSLDRCAGLDGRALRIAIYVHRFYPEHYLGTESYTLTLARGLVRLGCDVRIITNSIPGDPKQRLELERFSYEGLSVFRVDRTRGVFHSSEEYRLPQAKGLHQAIISEIDPDLIHVCHMQYHSTILLEVASELGIPVFATFTDFYAICFRTTLETADKTICHGPSPSRANCVSCGLATRAEAPSLTWRWLAKPFFRNIAASLAVRHDRVLPKRAREDVLAVKDRPSAMRKAYGHYQAAIVPTSRLRDSYRAHGFDLPIAVSPYGIDIDRRPKPPRTDSRLRLAFIGQLAPHKGPHLVIEAVRRLAVSDLSLEIWGSESRHPAYAAELRASAAGLPVTFRGTFDAALAPQVFAEIDAIVVASTWRENSPLVLLQALATHTPAIVSDVDGLIELVQDGVQGLIFRRGDPADLARVLGRLLREPGLVQRLASGAAYDRTGLDMATDVISLYQGRLATS